LCYLLRSAPRSFIENATSAKTICQADAVVREEQRREIARDKARLEMELEKMKVSSGYWVWFLSLPWLIHVWVSFRSGFILLSVFFVVVIIIIIIIIIIMQFLLILIVIIVIIIIIIIIIIIVILLLVGGSEGGAGYRSCKWWICTSLIICKLLTFPLLFSL
jgi:uncharacterized membrane protein